MTGLICTGAVALAWPPAVARADSPGEGYYEDANRQTVAFTPTYRAWFGPDRYELHVLRAVLENAGLLALELGVYWYDPDSNVVDWQYPDLLAKLTSREAFRFDDNLLQTNYVFHSFAGASHYLFTRVNGFGVPGAFSAALASSALYELVFEWKEIVSFNDLIVTPLGGMAMGEFFNQLGNYVNSGPPYATSTGNATARVTVGFPRALDEAVDEPGAPPALALDNLGLSSAYSHRFRVLFAEDSLDAGTGKLGRMFSADGEFALAGMPGLGRPGHFSTWFTNGNFTSFDVRLGYSGTSRDSELAFESHLLGWYGQKLSRSRGGLNGYTHETALGTGLYYVNRSYLGQEDRYGMVHILRPVSRTTLHFGPVELRFGGDVSPDFASIQSLASDAYGARFGMQGTKSSLSRHGYTHGWGVSSGGFSAVRASGLELAARARIGHYESIDGAERVQEEVTQETHASETLTNLEAELTFEPPAAPLSSRLEFAEVRHESTLAATHGARTTRRLSIGLGLVF